MEIGKWSSKTFGNYSEGVTRWGYWTTSIATIGSRLARKSSRGRQVMESFCTKFTCGCKRKVWRDKLVSDLSNDLAHMSFRLQP
jgi:hypothetical protein